MGYKIFVSYKYGDDSVYPLYNPEKMFSLSFDRSTVRDYVDKLEVYFDHTSNIYKGESDNEDLSYLLASVDFNHYESGRNRQK